MANIILLRLLMAGGIVAALTGSSWRRNEIFRTPPELWRATALRSSDKARPSQNYGQALTLAGRYGEALEQFSLVQSIKERRPDDLSVSEGDLYREIGVVYYRTGRYAQALSAWQRALLVDGMNPALLNNLALALLKTGRADEADAYARRALLLKPDLVEPLNTVGEVHMLRAEYREAADCFLRFLEQRPDDSVVLWNAAQAMIKTGAFREARRLTERFLALEDDPRWIGKAEALIAEIDRKSGAAAGRSGRGTK